MSVREYVKRLMTKGPVNAAQSALSVLEDYRFEKKYQLDTQSEVAIDDLDIDAEAKAQADKYKPTRKRYFRKVMEQLSLPPGGVFVDVGCGKGRVLLLASQCGFEEVLGLEISPRLTDIAKQNAVGFKNRASSCCPIRVECTNILDYRMTGVETVFFLYSPFGYEVTEQFLKNLRQSLESHPRNLWLIIDEFRFPELLEGDSYLELTEVYDYGAAVFHIYKHSIALREDTRN